MDSRKHYIQSEGQTQFGGYATHKKQLCFKIFFGSILQHSCALVGNAGAVQNVSGERGRQDTLGTPLSARLRRSFLCPLLRIPSLSVVNFFYKRIDIEQINEDEDVLHAFKLDLSDLIRSFKIWEWLTYIAVSRAKLCHPNGQFISTS